MHEWILACGTSATSGSPFLIVPGRTVTAEGSSCSEKVTGYSLPSNISTGGGASYIALMVGGHSDIIVTPTVSSGEEKVVFQQTEQLCEVSSR
eukprot:1324263-Rhodomonas_salina.2